MTTPLVSYTIRDLPVEVRNALRAIAKANGRTGASETRIALTKYVQEASIPITIEDALAKMKAARNGDRKPAAKRGRK